MNEHPILFSGEMVRAILEGRKTQTRRIVNRLSHKGKITELAFSVGRFIFRDKNALWNDVEEKYLLERCPYGQPGDHLWVRETWSVEHGHLSDEAASNFYVCYKADMAIGPANEKEGDLEKLSDTQSGEWRPSIFMPRWASRITLEVVNIRVERVQDITSQ